jgi:hypothetical protein
MSAVQAEGHDSLHSLRRVAVGLAPQRVKFGALCGERHQQCVALAGDGGESRVGFVPFGGDFRQPGFELGPLCLRRRGQGLHGGGQRRCCRLKVDHLLLQSFDPLFSLAKGAFHRLQQAQRGVGQLLRGFELPVLLGAAGLPRAAVHASSEATSTVWLLKPKSGNAATAAGGMVM